LKYILGIEKGTDQMCGRVPAHTYRSMGETKPVFSCRIEQQRRTKTKMMDNQTDRTTETLRTLLLGIDLI
jgi:hypothetical protein